MMRQSLDGVADSGDLDCVVSVSWRSNVSSGVSGGNMEFQRDADMA